uniref:Uncharacterized protein n=1 Tax=Rhizophora mucronata TaxID=61149 RepID=A0A2P2PU57_RHIMU
MQRTCFILQRKRDKQRQGNVLYCEEKRLGDGEEA